MHRILSLILATLFCFAAKLSSAAEYTSLAGQWRFALDRNDVGTNENWFAKDLPDKIQLPGILQAQGYGDDISTNTPWVLGLGDAWWNLQPAALRDHFSQPGHVEVPFLSQPPKHYLGAAWYQRDINIPSAKTGPVYTQVHQAQHYILFLERAHWQSKVWVDGKEFPANDSLVVSHITDLGTLTPGKHRLTIRVDNRLQLPAAGHLVDSHSISDALGAAWNGIVGKIELRAIPLVYIEDVQVYPHISNQTVTVKARIQNTTGKPGQGLGSISIGLDHTPKQSREFIAYFGPKTNVPVSWDANGGSFEINVPLNWLVKDPQNWSEFYPETYQLGVSLSTSALPTLDGCKYVTFGLREITTHDKDIFINGRPTNLRLTHFGGDFPLTGYPAMDVPSWKKIIQACKDYGFNGIRFHSWCPPEAAFEAADEMGFYLQPECGLWADFASPLMQHWLEDETARLLAAYGNHPSFILLSPSNEPRNYTRFLPQWAAENYAKDNRRLYAVDSGWGDPSQLTGAQYAVVARFGNNRNLRNSSGWFGNDFSDALTDVHIPVLSHEVGQWCAYPDFDVMKKFTGYLRPGNYDIFKYIAEQNGVLEMDHEFAQASGKFQLACYKEEIEANLRTPGLAGFQLLDLHDYLGQGTALIGILDTFWEGKGYASPDEFRQFCGPVVPLVRLGQRVFTTADKLETTVDVSNYGQEVITNGQVAWWISDRNGKVVRQSASSPKDLPIGKTFGFANISTELANLPAPAQYKLNVSVGPQPPKSYGKLPPSYQNSWTFWLYPAQVEDSKATDILTTSVWADAAKKLAAGGKVLFIPSEADLDPTKCPPMKNVPVFWNIQMTVRPPQNPRPRFDAMLGLLCETNHPALAEFPTDKNCDWQWTPLVNGVRSVNLTLAPRSLKPIVWAIDDWNRNWKLGVIFECNVGPGRLLVSAIDLKDGRSGPGLAQLRRSLMDYMAGAKFHPAATLTPDEAGKLWARGTVTTNEPARVFDPDLNDGSIPAKPAPKN